LLEAAPVAANLRRAQPPHRSAGLSFLTLSILPQSEQVLCLDQALRFSLITQQL
jgi:hypothetical protein